MLNYGRSLHLFVHCCNFLVLKEERSHPDSTPCIKIPAECGLCTNHTQKVRNKAWLFRPVGRVLINSSVVRIFPVVVPGVWHCAKCPSVGQQVWVLGRASRSQHGQVSDAGETHLGSTELSGSFNNPQMSHFKA